MKAYYTRLQRGEGRTEALRQVQLEMLKGAEGVQDVEQQRRGLSGPPGGKARARSYGHPYYWAGFIQSGAWSGIENKTGDAKRQ
jgi:CHAT domain-containing protein